MKILLVNNFYYHRGGDCTYLFSLKKLLENNGHKVITFSMNHPKNLYSEYAKYFVSYINYEEEVKKITPLSCLKVLSRTIFSKEAKNNIEQLIQHEKPDIAHLQNIHHHITPSIFFPLKKHKIPIVWTLHDFTIICPNTTCLQNGKICEACKELKYFWKPIIIKCKKHSHSASAMAVIESLIHKVTNVTNLVNLFVTPSEFLKNKLLEYKYDARKIVSLNNFIDIAPKDKNIVAGDYCMYSGRLSEEKGIKTLIDAVIKLKEVRLKILGDGPLKEELQLYSYSKDTSNRIEFLGHNSRDEVFELVKRCKFLIVPSEWYENFPYSILEAFAYEKPVIGSRIGGIPELVKDDITGLTFQTGNIEDLSEKILYLNNNPDKIIKMGQNARTFVANELNAEKHYQKLIEIYKQAKDKM